MATHSISTFVGVGSSNEPTIVEGRCKQCGKFISASSNSTLRLHFEKPYFPVLKVIPDGGQSSMSREGGLFVYEEDRARKQFARFVIQQGFPFNHSDNPRLTNIIQKCLQPRYTHVSRATFRRDALKMWKKAKLELINGFENLNTSVNLTNDVWSAPHGLPGSYLCVTAHWVDPATWQMMKRTIDFENIDYPHTDSESVFSLSGRVLSIRRTRLTPASLEMCICLKDHLNAQERIQHTSNLEGDCLEIEQQLLEVEAEAGYAINIADEEINLEKQATSGSNDSE
nr:zinc finger BED domain-containing protein RICESLEEPER 2 [Tanacetum cinerariifolium]